MVQETAVVKLCECGCGQPVSIAKYTFKERGYIKGQPVRFLPGHNARNGRCAHPKPIDWSDLPALYLEKKFSGIEIGKIKGCCEATVLYHLDMLQIPKRSAHQQQQIYWNRTPSNHYHTWKGGRLKQNGYIFIYMPDHPNAQSMGYVAEHRLVMEKKLGRYLFPSEKVHQVLTKSEK